MYTGIKNLFPDIDDSQFELRDDSDGQGPYIASWSYHQPQPTKIQIEAAEIAGPPPPFFTTDELIARAHSRINAAYSAAVNGFVSQYPESEISSWPKQEAEARAYFANQATPTPWIDSAARARGIPKDQLVVLIIQNADALALVHGTLTGKRQKLRDQIDALGGNPTPEQLDAIQW